MKDERGVSCVQILAFRGATWSRYLGWVSVNPYYLVNRNMFKIVDLESNLGTGSGHSDNLRL